MTTRRTNVRKLVREEFTKRLAEETAEGQHRRFEKVWATLPKDKYTPFGKWVRAKFAPSIPAEIADADVLDYLDKNPAVSRVTPVQLVDMFKSMPSIRAGLNSYDDDEFERLDAAVKGAKPGDGTKYKRGEATLSKTGDTLGVTSAGAKKIGDKAQEYYRKFYGGETPDDLDDEDFGGLFGAGGKFDAAVEKAADLYTRMLLASKGNVDKVFEALRKVGALQKDEASILSDAERVAVQHLADLAIEGNAEKVKELLKKDIDRPLEDSNVVKSFQNLVAMTIRRDINAAEIAAGERRGRGRPKGSTKVKPAPTA